MKPSVGRVVHYVSYGTPGGEYPSVCRAAIVTEAPSPLATSTLERLDEPVGLCVLNPEGIFLNRYALHDEVDKRGGTWHWPERVEE